MTRLSFVLATVVMAAAALDPRASQPKLYPAESPLIGTPTSQGCFKYLGSLEDCKNLGVVYDKNYRLSQGLCEKYAKEVDQPVFAMKGDICYVGKEYPAKSDLVEDSKCNYQCPGFPDDACGGLSDDGYFSVWNTGIEVAPPRADPAPAETSESASKDDEEEEEQESGGKSNVAGIAAGTVVGVVVIAAAVGGMFFYMRRKRNAEIEEEHRRNAAVNSFIGGGHSNSNSVSADSRLEPIMAQRRRMSDGSIADNEDYSRRILRVTNV